MKLTKTAKKFENNLKERYEKEMKLYEAMLKEAKNTKKGLKRK